MCRWGLEHAYKCMLGSFRFPGILLHIPQSTHCMQEFSNWPTFPQLFVNGELIGGCDIVLEMAETGELKVGSLQGHGCNIADRVASPGA